MIWIVGPNKPLIKAFKCTRKLEKMNGNIIANFLLFPTLGLVTYSLIGGSLPKIYQLYWMWNTLKSVVTYGCLDFTTKVVAFRVNHIVHNQRISVPLLLRFIL